MLHPRKQTRKGKGHGNGDAPLPPQNGHLSTTATFICPQGGRCGEVRLHFIDTLLINNYMQWWIYRRSKWGASEEIFNLSGDTFFNSESSLSLQSSNRLSNKDKEGH